MTALHAVPDLTESKGFVVRLVEDAGPRWRARAERRGDRRHQTMLALEELRRETPWYEFRLRRALHRAIVSLVGKD